VGVLKIREIHRFDVGTTLREGNFSSLVEGTGGHATARQESDSRKGVSDERVIGTV